MAFSFVFFADICLESYRNQPRVTSFQFVTRWHSMVNILQSDNTIHYLFRTVFLSSNCSHYWSNFSTFYRCWIVTLRLSIIPIATRDCFKLCFNTCKHVFVIQMKGETLLTILLLFSRFLFGYGKTKIIIKLVLI